MDDSAIVAVRLDVYLRDLVGSLELEFVFLARRGLVGLSLVRGRVGSLCELLVHATVVGWALVVGRRMMGSYGTIWRACGRALFESACGSPGSLLVHMDERSTGF